MTLQSVFLTLSVRATHFIQNMFAAGIVMLAGVALFPLSAEATIYISYDAESLTCGSQVPQSIMDGAGSQDYPLNIPTVGCDGTPNGSKYFRFNFQQGMHDFGNSMHVAGGATPNLVGRTVWLGYFAEFDEINGVYIWTPVGNDWGNDSGDKGTEVARGLGIRWDISQGYGQWGKSMADHANHKFTVWMGNPSYHLNSSLEYYDALPANQSGYGTAGSNYGINTNVQLAVGRWHSFVLKLTVADTNTGEAAMYVDGVLISRYTGIRTSSTDPGQIEEIVIGGTACQPANNCPSHIRKYDAFILTDNEQDILSGGYYNDPGSGGTPDTTAPTAPTGLVVQ